MWTPTDREHVTEVRVPPNIARAASALRGRGARYASPTGSAVDRLVDERRREDREAEPR